MSVNLKVFNSFGKGSKHRSVLGLSVVPRAGLEPATDGDITRYSHYYPRKSPLFHSLKITTTTLLPILSRKLRNL